MTETVVTGGVQSDAVMTDAVPSDTAVTGGVLSDAVMTDAVMTDAVPSDTAVTGGVPGDAVMLRGYRSEDVPLLTGHWLRAELLGLAPPGVPGTADPTVVPAPRDATEELCILPGAGFVRFAELDWVHRRARLEIGLQPKAAGCALSALTVALTHALRVLNLHRVYGWATPDAGAPTALLAQAGLRQEATVPEAFWLGGRPVGRQIWGAVLDA
jgi:hypothetical protein